MDKSKVYFTTFKTSYTENLIQKLHRLMKQAGFENIDFTDKYAFSNGTVTVAYNFDDLTKVIRIYNSKATVEDLIALAEACSYEEVQARRGA